MPSNVVTGGQALVAALRAHRVDTVFCVPGESYLPVLDALYDESEHIKLISCRQEGGAGFMAEAYGKLTGKPGICFVTRGPGACNASVAVHTAFQNSTPMILLIGQVSREQWGREAFQEIDYGKMFPAMTKWTMQIEQADDIPEVLNRAFQIAISGRRGPVVIALPEDILTEVCKTKVSQPLTIPASIPDKESIKQFSELLSLAQRPVVLLGGTGWSATACKNIQQFSEKNKLPVSATFRRQDLFDNAHPNYIGDAGIGINPKLAERIKQADLIIAIGTRLGEMATSDYTLLTVPKPKQTLIHIHAGAEELGRVYQADLQIHADMESFAKQISDLEIQSTINHSVALKQARADYLEWVKPASQSVYQINLSQLVAYMREILPDDAIVANGAGNYTSWLHRYYQYKTFKTQLAPTNGTMGYGVPAAVAAKALHPQRIVVAMAGDGCFMMNGQELATAVQYRLPIIIIVFNNGMYGTIRMHQEKNYPGRVSGTDLVNPDFAAYARSFGAAGERVYSLEDFKPVFEKALRHPQSTLIEIKIEPEMISPTTSLSELRERALATKTI